MRSTNQPSIDGAALAGIFMLVVMVFNLLAEPSTSVGAASAKEVRIPAKAAVQEAPQPDWDAVAAPYDEYVVTQGPHGYSYGHAAVDLAAGKGAVILSPIHGEVVDHYIDQWGNPTLVIENERYRVLLLHGVYSAALGQAVALGDQVGVESNQGYTVDFQGRSCAGRDCGYHTHLNIYDKQLGANVNPLELIDR